MKKLLSIILTALIIFSCYQTIQYTFVNKSKEDMANKLIRFHVIANSDSKEDQALKLKVKNKILELLYPKLNKSNSIEESRQILNTSTEDIIKLSKDVIVKSGYNYNVQASLSRENFPIKSYGSITLPQGNYEAYRIIIGDGLGQNWWCVMFPPLCFVDITKEEISTKETEESIKKVLTKDEYETIDNSKPKLKLKSVELIEKFFQ